jgi:hypothetical protein
MRRQVDLDRLDRATLRVWRWSNLVGWGLIGALVTWTLGAATNVVTGRMSDLGLEHAGNAIGLVAAFLSTVAGGALVGARVYRSPGLVAYVGQVALGFAWIAWRFAVAHEAWNPTAFAVNCMVLFTFPVFAAMGAVAVWGRRPHALRHEARRGRSNIGSTTP